VYDDSNSDKGFRLIFDLMIKKGENACKFIGQEE
jgi:hypothetical protein